MIINNHQDVYDYCINHDKLGNVVWEGWYLNDSLHRENDLPAFRFYENEGKGYLKSESWYLNGKNHRDKDLPSSISYYPNGNIKRKSWSIDGKNHRNNDQPAVIDYDIEGDILKETWYLQGKLHREGDQPALIEYFANNEIDKFVKSQRWFKNDLKFRYGNKPIIIDFFPNGIKRMEEFFYFDEKDLPSVIFYYMNGNTKSQIYYHNKSIHRFGFSITGDGILDFKPAIIKFDRNGYKQNCYMLYNKELSLEKYLRYLFLFRRTINRYKYNKRKEIRNILKCSKFSEKNGKNICELVSFFVY